MQQLLTPLCPYTWETIKQFQGGTAIFTVPETPIKCGGAPQKVMYLADDHFKGRDRQLAEDSEIFYTMFWRLFDRTPAALMPKPTPVRRSRCGSRVIVKRSAFVMPSRRLNARAMFSGFTRQSRAAT